MKQNNLVTITHLPDSYKPNIKNRWVVYLNGYPHYYKYKCNAIRAMKQLGKEIIIYEPGKLYEKS